MSVPIFAALASLPPDPLLGLIAAYAADPRPEKIDVGVGVYRDATGATPVFRAVKIAENMLARTQATKAYLGGAGDVGFVDCLKPIIFGSALSSSPCLTGVQTPGGMGALRLAGELIARGNPGATVWLSRPTWPAHAPVFRASGLKVAEYCYFDLAQQVVQFDCMLAALAKAPAGDVVLLHGACHNPTGADLTLDQWIKVVSLCTQRGLIPLIDLAYEGLGAGLETDAAALRALCAALDTVIVAYSCDKNFGLYRDRVGALFVQMPDAALALRVRAHILFLARALWSMPPDHGAAVVRLILEDTILTALWKDELKTMRLRIRELRTALAAIDTRLASISCQNGLFSTLNLGEENVADLARDHAIYIAAPGRINIAGLRPNQIERFSRAVLSYL